MTHRNQSKKLKKEIASERNNPMKQTKLALAVASSLAATPVFATNGMNMEGYGPISSAMGGTASAYENGLGGMMNNPATLGMSHQSGNKFQVAVGQLNPAVSAEHKDNGLKTDSSGSFTMPGFGYARKSDGLTLGIGILSQGGMGTDFGKATSQTDLFAGGMSTGRADPTTGTYFDAQDQIALSGETIRSEVGVGRVILPVAYDVTSQLTVAASLDYVWGGMDLQMDMDGAGFEQLMQGNGGSVSGSMAGTGDATNPGLAEMMTPFDQTTSTDAAINDVNWARFDFSDNSAFTQATKGAGFAGKLGATFQITPQLSVGASYHSKTKMSDFEGDATLSMNVNMDTGIAQTGTTPSGTYADMTMPVTGKIKVVDFQWPETMALGVTYRGSEKWMVSADIKRIGWSSVMDKFAMTFTADNSTNNGAFANKTLNVTMDQNWDDQTVVMLGGQFMAMDNLALRAGYNQASNPVPKETLNPLFPAIVEKHYTFGFGYEMDKNQIIDFSMTIAPEVSVTSTSGVTANHSQTNWQLMYTYAWGGSPRK